MQPNREQNKEDSNQLKKNENYNVVIVGMGPVGLTAAYELAKNGNKVLIIEKRSKEDAAIRPQVVVVNPKSKKQLLDMINADSTLSDEDVKFLDVLTHSSEVKVNTIQRFVLNRIEELNKKKEQQNDPSIVKLKYQNSLTSISFEKDTVTKLNEKTKRTKDITFNHLIAADGAHSQTFLQVEKILKDMTTKGKDNKDKNNQDNKDEAEQDIKDEAEQDYKNNKIWKYTPKDMEQEGKKYHLYAYVKLSSKNDGEYLPLPKKEFVSAFLENKIGKKTTNQLYFLRFDKKSYNKSKQTSTKMAYVGEIPEDVYHLHKAYNQTIGVLEDVLKEKLKSFDALVKLIKIKIELSETAGYDSKNSKWLDDAINNLYSEASVEEIQKDVITKRNEFTLSYVIKATANYLKNLKIPEGELKAEITNSKNTPKKDRLKMLTFQGGSIKANKAAIQVNNHGFYLIGDAFFTPNYTVGHGLNNGFESAKLLGEIPNKGNAEPTKLTDHVSRYNSLANKNALAARSMMQAIRRIRKVKKVRILLPKTLEALVEKGEKKDRIDLSKHLAKDGNNEDAISRFIATKFNVIDVKKALSSDNPSEDLKNKIETWKKFLIKNPSITEQYKEKILEHLKSIINGISNPDKDKILKHLEEIKNDISNPSFLKEFEKFLKESNKDIQNKESKGPQMNTSSMPTSVTPPPKVEQRSEWKVAKKKTQEPKKNIVIGEARKPQMNSDPVPQKLTKPLQNSTTSTTSAVQCALCVNPENAKKALEKKISETKSKQGTVTVTVIERKNVAEITKKFEKMAEASKTEVSNTPKRPGKW